MKSLENDEIIMTIKMIKITTVIMTIIVTIMMIRRIKFGNRIEV